MSAASSASNSIGEPRVYFGRIVFGGYRPAEDIVSDMPRLLSIASVWRPIETIPQDGNDVLVCNANLVGGACQVVHWNDELPSGYTLSTSDGPSFHPAAFTHWMPLPPIPGAPT